MTFPQALKVMNMKTEVPVRHLAAAIRHWLDAASERGEQRRREVGESTVLCARACVCERECVCVCVRAHLRSYMCASVLHQKFLLRNYSKY